MHAIAKDFAKMIFFGDLASINVQVLDSNFEKVKLSKTISNSHECPHCM